MVQYINQLRKNILIIWPYSAANTIYKLIIDGIRKPLFEEFGDGLNLHIEYLERDRLQEEKDMEKIIELYNEKYLNMDINLLICVGVDAVSPIKKYAANFLLNIRIINLDFDFSRNGILMDK